MPRFCRAPLTPTLILALAMGRVAMCQFTLQGPGVDPADFRVTTFAMGLNFPVSMTDLADGSLLVATSNGGSFFGSTTGSLMRLADADEDGTAETQQTLVSNVPGGRLTSVRRAGDLIAVTGQGQTNPISFYRTGPAPSDPLSFLGRIDLDYPNGGWLHPHSSLALRSVAGQAGKYELYFQLGSDTNFAVTTRTVNLGGTLGLSATLAGDAIHRITITDNGTTLTASEHTQIATGLRNASGLAFHPQTGDFYIGENGIDGLVNSNEPHSADEINVIPAAELGESVANFGFPSTYQEYRTGTTIGSTGILPLIAFQPIPPPEGAEAEGINEIAFAPPAFPVALRDGLFAGFHGRFSLGGLQNEENPVAFVDLATGEYFHFIGSDEPAIGHPDGFHSTHDTLYLSDMSPSGGLGGAQAGTGRIYAIRSLLTPLTGDYNGSGEVDAADYIVWRDTLGSTLELAADGDRSGTVDALDYQLWRQNFGATGGARSSEQSKTVVPEPGTMALAIMSAMWAVVASVWRTCFAARPVAACVHNRDDKKRIDDPIDFVIIDRLRCWCLESTTGTFPRRLPIGCCEVGQPAGIISET
jgi:glucose/arabinose dehydrogenase